MDEYSKGIDYLDKNVKSILFPILEEVVKTQPEDPLLFFIEWMQKLSGRPYAKETSEYVELTKLRREIERLKKIKEEKGDKEDEEILKSESERSEGSDEEEQDKVEELIKTQKNKVSTKGQRSSVSAEVYGFFNKKQDFKAKVITKTDEQRERIIKRMSMSFLFNMLEEKDFKVVIDAMEENKYPQGSYVIKQGESGDVLYLVDTGELNCEKLFVSIKINYIFSI
jgi:hypothetical protein